MNVLIVDDHAIVRQGLRQILTESGKIDLIAEAESGGEAMRQLREGEWSVVVLDISLPDRNGIEVLKQIRKERPKLPVLMLSMHEEGLYAIRALKAGAFGYITKQSAPNELMAAINQAARGRKYLTPAVAEAMAESLGTDHDRPLHETLSDREYQTLRLIASGKSLTDAAEEMHLSVKTVSVYRGRLLQKMKLKNNAEVTHYAIKNGLA
ncbi:response regulator [Nitrosospira multiformis]|jgi:DNA-binding NarL/FixJ family response regulator|uniref:Two component transcriptional regulator, LuxR family n=1 Tax=Nitrosospira multiformis (strain ATCC 25196 / NCIMB 11849 / C 71) TaxID=323848 RepID=Q2Y9D2_NITMU|nr:response regulator transcription factor [Nitrosospira multiformis]ABB74639.1 two component transcriptional regulator, LuxR family [Nitrosospira multiformis ATCC 25196]SDZ83479.1 two component transcriptional regulator, LuxR family [Nitrosospira multiformis]SEF72353.1 two component transcriptional regulator, LuxR family [Nitrosospira multiformis ATCC 25196]